MKRSSMIGILAVLVVFLAGSKGRASRGQLPQVSKELSNQEINDSFVERISKQIAGHEQEPSGQVSRNIQADFLKKVPAGRLLLIMNQGYSRALGVNCKHCHVADDFSKDDLRPKRCARDMALMHFSINQQLVKMQNLAPNPNGHYINCSTCHRGQIDPMAQEPNSLRGNDLGLSL